MLDVVRDLRAHHFAILLDGYGSGHSSLNLLKDDYFDVLKLDMRVLRDSTVDDRAERILRLVAQMAEILKLKRNVVKIKGRCYVDGDLAAEAICMSAFTPPATTPTPQPAAKGGE